MIEGAQEYFQVLQKENSLENIEKKTEEYEPHFLKFYRTKGIQFHVEGEEQIRLYAVKFVNPLAKAKILLSTGYNESQLKYAELIKNYYDAGYSVYGYDHRGQGYSQRLPFQNAKGHMDNFDYLLRDMARVFHVVLKDDNQNLPIFSIAHSMGGAVTTACVIQKLIHPKAVVLSAPMYQIYGFQTKLLESAASLLSKSMCFFHFDHSYVFGQKDCVAFIPFENNDLTNSKFRFQIWRKLISQIDQMRLGGVTYGWVKEASRIMPFIRENAKSFHVPLLLLKADADTVVNPEAIVHFAKEAPKASVFEFPGAKHELFMEIDFVRDQVLNKSLHFMNSIL